MTIPTTPRRFENDGGNLDMEAVNDNFEAIAANIKRNLDARYTYSELHFDLDGVTNASAAVLRAFAIRRPAAGRGVEVCGVEVVIYAAGTEVWTLACSDTSWPSITVTAAGATTEATAISDMPVSVPSESADVTFTMSAGAASTITRGYIVVHLRCDRGNQGTTHTPYSPTLINSATSTAASVINTQLDAATTAVGYDTANDVDLRCECFTVRSLASGSSAVWRLPSGARRILGSTQYIVGAAGSIATGTVTGTGLTGSSAAATATGATVLVATTDAASGTMNDDPTDTADDATVTIAITGAVTADLAYLLIWWS